MKSPPRNWPRISSAIFYEDPRRAITFLCEAFGFKVRILVEGEDGRVHHSELEFGEGLIMVGDVASPRDTWRRSPRQIGGGSTQAMGLFVDDVDAHCAHARAAGAIIDQEPEDHDYGEAYWTDRSYGAVDLEGHHWWFSQRLREQKE